MKLELNPRKFAADTLSMTSFGLAVGGLTELLIAGLHGKEFLKSRFISGASNLVTGRPYGIYRDWVFEKCGGELPGRHIKNGLIEIAAFASFQAPLYAATLALAGADYEQVSKAVTTTTFLAPFIARPNGLYMKWMRSKCGVRE